MIGRMAGRLSEIESVLVEERLIGYLDPGAEKILLALNRVPRISTTSSCMGRITIVEGEWHWLREDARIVYKTHSPITVDEVEKVMSRGFDNLWFKATGPILHLRVHGIQCALSILARARNHGFKHSGIISASIGEDENLVLEIMSSLAIAAPLVAEGRRLLSTDALSTIVGMANSILETGRANLDKFVKEVIHIKKCL